MTQEMKALDLEGRFLPPGEVIAERFKLGQKVGEGPFGQVYRADDTLVEAEVAVKVFDDAVTKTPVDEERFVKATRRARALTQKNVVRLHDSGVHHDHPWVSMQLLEGLNLRKVVRLRRQREESFGLDELDPLLSQITLALQHVNRDFPHGNLKPENVIFLPDFVKITDNYVLSALPDKIFAERLTDERFVAPELKSPGREPDARCDVYSVGKLIGFILFGDDYRPGDEADAPGSLAAVDTLCRRATADDPAQRYSSVEALNEDFAAVVDTGSLLTSPAKPVRPAGAEPIPETEETVVTTAPKRTTPQRHEDDNVAESTTPSADVAEKKSSPDTAPVSAESTAPSRPDGGLDNADAADGTEQPVADTPDPLDVETSPEIGAPPEEELPTTEYDRDDEPTELQDMLPTEEVDRRGHPGPDDAPKARDDESAPDAASPPPAASPSKKRGRPSKSGSKRKKDGGGPPLGLIVGAMVVMALFAGVVVVALVLPFDDTDDQAAEADEPVAQQGETDESDDEDAVAEKDSEETEEGRKRQKELEQLRQERREATTTAISVSDDAYAQALEEAKAEEERIEEEQEEQEAAVGAASTPGGAAQPTQPAATQCPAGMVRFSVGGEFVCIDTHQHPGQGQRPQTNVSWFDARSACQNQGKRLCTLQEWRGACGHGYPYGASFNPDACNTADADGFDRSLAETGSFPQCRSHVGAYDMSGNVHEWVEEQRVAGGAFDSAADMARCDYSSAMSAGNSRPNVGFRCCADPE